MNCESSGVEPKTINQISITRALGSGGMGDVFEGFDQVLKRKVAVKIIKSKLLSTPNRRRRFLREAQILSQLEHPNICRVHNFFSHESQDYLVLEFLQGTTLKETIPQLQSLKRKVEIAIAITQAMKVAHSINIVHRDLKPENIMVLDDGTVKVLDFGLAYCSSHGDIHPNDVEQDLNRPEVSLDPQDYRNESLTQTGAVKGTLAYMSPEQIWGDPATTASDIYALGLIFQELFSGQCPYDMELPYNEQYRKVMASKTLPIKNVRRDIKSLILAMQRHTPEERPHATEVLERLLTIQDRPKRLRKQGIIMAIIGTLFIAAVLSSIGLIQANRANQQAQISRKRAEYVTKFIQDMLTSADPSREGIDVKVVDILNLASKRAQTGGDENFLSKASILEALGQSYHAIGKYRDADQHLKHAISLRQQKSNLSDEDLIKTTILYSMNLSRMGDYSTAELYARKVLEQCQKFLPEDSIQTIKAKHALVIALYQQERNMVAEKECLRVLASAETLLGSRHELTMDILGTLGTIYFYQNRAEEAISTWRRLIERQSQSLGFEHPNLLISKNNLAFILMAQGSFKQAESIQRENLVTAQNVFGKNHPMTLTALNNLGRTLAAMERYAEAFDLHREAVTQRKAQLGPFHPSTAVAWYSLAKALQGLKRYEDSEKAYLEAFSIETKLYGEGYEDTQETMVSLAQMLLEKGDSQRADQWLARAEKAGHPEAKSMRTQIKTKARND